MSKLLKKGKKNLGVIVAAIGIGILLTVVIPLWGWVVAAGIALIYCGWKIMDNRHH